MVYYSHYPSDCPICEDAGRAENWRKDENLHQTSTYPSELRTSSVNCLLCEAILLGLQQSPQGRALLEDTKEFRLDLRRRSRFDFPSWKNEYFEVNCLEFARDGLSCAFELFRTSGRSCQIRGLNPCTNTLERMFERTNSRHFLSFQ